MKCFEDTFNLLCGKKIGEGIHRNVFECRLLPDLVVKVEKKEDWRYFSNVHEMKFWSDYQYAPDIAQWLAPCDFMSPDGHILLQRKVRAIHQSDILPDKLPTFLTDIKRENFGWLDGKLVCIDYAFTILNPSKRLKKVEW